MSKEFLTVEITGVSEPGYWYRRLVGQRFRAYRDPHFGYTVDDGPAPIEPRVYRHISEADCKVVSEDQPEVPAATATLPPDAHAFLDRAAALLGERGAQYDKCAGERSMGKTVAAFNAITGHRLDEQDGWLLLLLLKQVRQWTTPNKFHRDSAEDGVAYAALLAEALQKNKESANA